MDINEALKTIVMQKAKRMTEKDDDDKYTEHIRGILNDYNISAKKDVVQAFKMGAVDAMIYDVGSALGFIRINKYDYRKEILMELFHKQ